VEVWERQAAAREGVYRGEVTTPLNALMDLGVHRLTLPLSDPEGCVAGDVTGQLSFEVGLEA